MDNRFSRLELLVKEEGLRRLANTHVAVFGIGGVGGYVVEALARSGVGHFTLIDNDVVSLTNLNRQIIATSETIGQFKVDVMANRIRSINDQAIVEVKKCFYLPELEDEFDFNQYDYIVDCVDTVTAKLSIILKAKECNKPVISAMGAGNKMDPAMLEVSDISKTSVDPLSRIMRLELRKRGINHLKVVYSKEKPIKLEGDKHLDYKEKGTRNVPGSNAFVPSSMGLIMASEIIKDILK